MRTRWTFLAISFAIPMQDAGGPPWMLSRSAATWRILKPALPADRGLPTRVSLGPEMALEDELRPAAQPAIARVLAVEIREPLPRRHCEPGLAARDHGADLARRRGLSHRQLRRRRRPGQSRRQFAEHPRIDQGRADLDRMRHPGPIRVAQKLVAHVPGHLERRDPRTVAPQPCRCL